MTLSVPVGPGERRAPVVADCGGGWLEGEVQARFDRLRRGSSRFAGISRGAERTLAPAPQPG